MFGTDDEVAKMAMDHMKARVRAIAFDCEITDPDELLRWASGDPEIRDLIQMILISKVSDVLGLGRWTLLPDGSDRWRAMCLANDQ